MTQEVPHTNIGVKARRRIARGKCYVLQQAATPFYHSHHKIKLMHCLFWCISPQWARASSFTRFLDRTQQRPTVGRTPLDEWSARHRDLYLTTHNTHNRQMPMPPVRFEPTTPAGERPQTYVLDRAATGTGIIKLIIPHNLETNAARQIETLGLEDDSMTILRNV